MCSVSAFVLLVCAVRYSQFQYDGLDLGIYHQVLWNSAHGRWFQFSFNEPSYLVDHREWLLVLLVPVYWLINHPFVLIVVQTLAVNSAAIPFYLLIRRVIPQSPRVALIGAVLVLLHPTVLNMQFFEFHLLVCVVPLTFWWWYGVVTRRFWRWIFFALLLLLREDVAITTAAAGILIWLLDRSRWKEAGTVVVASGLWFALMVWAGAYFSIEDTPLFFSLYSWMGNSPLMALQFMFLHPFQVVLHLLSFNNLFLLFLFFMTTAFLPFVALRYMLPALAGLMVYFFMDAIDIGMAIFVYHYGAPMAAWSCIAAVYGCARLFHEGKPLRLPFFTAKDFEQLGGPIILMTCVATFLFFGPQWIVLDTWNARHEDTVGMQAAVQTISAEAGVLTSDRTYVQLSSREQLYSAKYTQTGLKHYSSLPYQFKPFQWALLTDDTPRVWNNNTIEQKRVATERLRDQIQQNDLIPVQLFEQGVLYGPRTSGLTEQSAIIESPVIAQQPINQRIHPTATLVSYGYDNATQQFHLQLKREDDAIAQSFLKDYINQQDVFVQVRWKTARGFSAKTQYRLLGSLVDPLYLWQPSTARTMILPWKWPVDAQSVELQFGTLTTPQQFFFVTQTTPLIFQSISSEYDTVRPVVPINEGCRTDYDAASGSCSLNTR